MSTATALINRKRFADLYDTYIVKGFHRSMHPIRMLDIIADLKTHYTQLPQSARIEEAEAQVKQRIESMSPIKKVIMLDTYKTH